MQGIRPPAVAGMFYSANPAQLAHEVFTMLMMSTATEPGVPKALIVPHAGYMYSGPIAATAYASLRQSKPSRVVLLGPAHRVRVRGLVLPQAEAFDTPLGRVPIAHEAAAHLGLKKSDEAHAREHSLEVQLPFLQTLLTDFDLVPLVVGDASTEEVAEVLERLWGGPETLILISSDLSHYLSYPKAKSIDSKTAGKIMGLDGAVGYQEACGSIPINGLLLVARKKGLVVKQLDLRNSGDTAGKKNEVVGYGAFAFYEDAGRGARS